MSLIIIGAGRGRRLEHLTAAEPKTFTEIQGQRILDWTLEAHAIRPNPDIVFIGGYLIDTVRQHYPEFTFRHNTNWENNNILQSLFYAADCLDQGFTCSYSDILYTPEVVKKIQASSADITIAVDTDWRARYQHRSRHPTADAEKVTALEGRITCLRRAIPDDEASGEIIGLAKFSPAVAALLKRYYYALPEQHQFEKSIPLNRAYLIHFLNYLVQQHGVTINYVTTPGDYIEVDTLEDHAYAQTHWPPSLIS